jgi:hypothetical protein
MLRDQQQHERRGAGSMAWRAIIELRFKQRISFYSAMNRDKCQAIICFRP